MSRVKGDVRTGASLAALGGLEETYLPSRRRPAYIGGASSVQAADRNAGTCRPDVEVGQAQSAELDAKGRTASRRHGERESTDAGHRDGTPRSSDEAR